MYRTVIVMTDDRDTTNLVEPEVTTIETQRVIADQCVALLKTIAATFLLQTIVVHAVATDTKSHIVGRHMRHLVAGRPLGAAPHPELALLRGAIAVRTS
jgi:hypothetical protein